jgi:hypothetical protein
MLGWVTTLKAVPSLDLDNWIYKRAAFINIGFLSVLFSGLVLFFSGFYDVFEPVIKDVRGKRAVDSQGLQVRAEVASRRGILKRSRHRTIFSWRRVNSITRTLFFYFTCMGCLPDQFAKVFIRVRLRYTSFNMINNRSFFSFFF